MSAQADMTEPGAGRDEPVAVVGAACRFPGRADSLTSLWRLLMARRDTAREVPAERWEQAELAGLPDRVADRLRYGCFLDEDVYAYEPEFFGINAQEAPWVDPEHRLLSEVVWEAIEHAGIPARRLSGTSTGMFFGIYQKDYMLRVQRPLEEVDAYAMYTGFDSIGPGRVGFLLDLRGPQVVVESACASGLVAVHTACQSLRTGESDVALAGATMLTLGPEGVTAPALWGVFSPTGRCHAFDAAADGYVRGEGCGVVVLKRLADAVRAGDRVLAVLRGTAVNQNGRGTRLSAPSEPAQIDLYRLALQRAGVEAGDVGMVEAHGPGTAVGDPIEFGAVAAVYGKGRDRCALGSVKTNIGHTEPVSGVAGLLKAIASLRHGLVPASLHFRDWNPQIDAGGTRLFVPTDTTEWPVRDGVRLAAVSSFGISGTNTHVVLEQPPAPRPARHAARPLLPGQSGGPDAPGGPGRVREDGTPRVFPLSAGTPVALRSAAGRLAEWLRGEGAGTPLDDVAHTLAVRRSPARERAAVVAAGRTELVARLEELAAGTVPPAGVATGRAVPDAGQGVVWVFAGHGSQWAGMCHGLLDRDPEFTRVIDALEPLVAEESGFSLRETLHRPEVVAGFDRVQPVIFAVQLGLAAMWRSHGVEPAAVIGHSMGEVAAAVAAGGLSLRDGVRVICRRSRLILRTAGRGLMASVALGRDEVERLLAEQEVRGVTVAVVASPENTVVGGDADRVRRLAEEWDARGIGIRVIEVDVASHTAHMDTVLPDLADALADVTGRTPETAFYSTVTDDPRDRAAFDAAYWSDNLRRTVCLTDAVRAAAEDGHRMFVEIGPHPVLSQPVQATLAAHGHTGTVVVPSLLRDTDDALAFHTHVAALHCAGHPLDWADRHADGTLADVPPTTWERTRYVVDPSPLRRPAGARSAPASHPLTGPRTADPDDDGRHLWQTGITPTTLPWLAGHRVDDVVVVPGAALCEMAVAAAADLYGTGPERLRVTGVDLARLLLPAPGGTPVTATAEATGPDTARWRVVSTAPDGTRVRHAQAYLHRTPEEETLPEHGDPQALLARFPYAVDASEIYRQMREERGVHHGPPFLGLRSLFTDTAPEEPAQGVGSRLLARVRVPDEGRAGVQALHCHPVALDTCLQAVAGAVLRTDSVPAGGILPRRIEGLRLYGTVPLSGYCLVTLTHADGCRYTADFRLWADDGAVVADATGVEFHHVPAESAEERFARRLLGTSWEPCERPAPEAAAGAWTVLAEPGREAYGSALAEALAEQGAAVDVRTLAPDATPEDTPVPPPSAPGAPAPRAVVYLPAPCTAPGAASPDLQARDQVARLVGTARRLAEEGGAAAPRLWTVTGAAQQVLPGDQPDLGQAGLRGLVRVLSYEHPELRPGVLDVDAHTPVRDVAAELLACPDEQDEVAYRRGARHLARLRNAPLQEHERRHATVDRGQDRVALHLARPGDPDSLEFTAQSRRRPRAGEIEVRLDATSVNFINVLQVMGVYQGFSTGEEHPEVSAFDGAGVVTAVGEGVRGVREGDRVAAMFVDGDRSAVMASFATVRADCVLPVPDALSATDAAGLPCAYLTAWYALRYLARLRPGEQVLVHSASGGTGLAALNLARACGADVLATAGSETKRAYLRSLGVRHVMDSRTLDFAGQVRELTEGRGVDVVLNSLTGPAQSASLDLLAHRGRFVELGKRDIHAGTRLGLLPFRRNVTFTGVDVLMLMRREPSLLAEGYRELTRMFADGTLPLLPVTEHPVAEAPSVFHTMAAARHTGKLVLTWPTEGTAGLPVRPEDVTAVRPDGSYLVTGGLGGLGLLVARWLAERGAGSVVLASRTAPTAAARTALTAFSGTRVKIVNGDVAEPGTADALVRAARASGHPLRGIVHAAAVVEDATVASLSPDLLERVWRPKATGAWLLHQAVEAAGDAGPELDWWVTFSSAASLLGNPGQGAYAAANAWLDEFTSWRRAQGLPATCVNWGPWAQAGRGTVMAERGYAMIAPEEGIAALERILAHGRDRTAYTPVDLPRWLDSYPATARTAFFAGLAAPAAGADPSDTRSALLESLRRTDEPERRRQILRDGVVAHVSAVLRLGTDRFDADTSLVTLGLDSLLAIALRNRLQRELGLDIPTTVMWTHPTAAALTRYLLARLHPDRDRGDAHAGPEPAVTVPAAGS
ncbi:mycocerosic acid synthase-like polyketide synthase [Streptomyces ruber]|uniref:Mycocerosic acid synthase-like polyketide synthase n=2 Tax=Streptomyces TaxID=1883 RepID=A0A918BCQ9_9ACTN|nr:type I polyketide synthase [Streptomyces ruber]GGQ52331.1 mycocerosic acid synthase-like polyketide synthase [Streptomyces ruber]